MGVNGTRALVPIHESRHYIRFASPINFFFFFNISEQQLCSFSFLCASQFSFFEIYSINGKYGGGGFLTLRNRFPKSVSARKGIREQKKKALYFCWMYGCARLLSIEAPSIQELNSQITLLLFSLGDEGPVLTRISIFSPPSSDPTAFLARHFQPLPSRPKEIQMILVAIAEIIHEFQFIFNPFTLL